LGGVFFEQDRSWDDFGSVAILAQDKILAGTLGCLAFRLVALWAWRILQAPQI